MDDAYVTLFIGKHGIRISLSKLPPQTGNFLQNPSVIFAGYDNNEKKEILREATGVVVGRVLELKKMPAPTGLLPGEGPPVELHFLAAGLMGSLYGVNLNVSAESEMEERLKAFFLKAFQSFIVGKERVNLQAALTRTLLSSSYSQPHHPFHFPRQRPPLIDSSQTALQKQSQEVKKDREDEEEKTLKKQRPTKMKRERKRSKTQKGCCWKKRAERASLLDKKSIHQEIVYVLGCFLHLPSD
ncbi:hypothetical protein MRB53_027457 [Persea americana]|uniref:Uncharacterized protein n=1 Tax=Persea americana TaxID=3435 RepID=A0ACC2LKW3_PERAE|nr:hypothetical protein MRB53_027457 [Persea americana]